MAFSLLGGLLLSQARLTGSLEVLKSQQPPELTAAQGQSTSGFPRQANLAAQKSTKPPRKKDIAKSCFTGFKGNVKQSNFHSKQDSVR